MRDPQPHNDATNTEARGRDRRRWRLNFVMHERRTGFDRRRPGTWSARFQERVLARLRDHDRNVLALLVTANILNVLDFLFTLRALDHGAVEANPFMRMLLSLDPATAGSREGGHHAGRRRSWCGGSAATVSPSWPGSRSPSCSAWYSSTTSTE